jgi:hypothetical protein
VFLDTIYDITSVHRQCHHERELKVKPGGRSRIQNMDLLLAITTLHQFITLKMIFTNAKKYSMTLSKKFRVGLVEVYMRLCTTPFVEV